MRQVLAGKVIKVEKREVGRKQLDMTKVDIVVGEKSYETLKIWFEQSVLAVELQKGDHIIAVGDYNVEEYNGKKYASLNVGAFGGSDGFFFSPELLSRKAGFEWIPPKKVKEKKEEELVELDISSDDLPF